ncbi:hypothetical protein NDK50_07850 [Paraburkholderia bryophila]|uniref:hypothetical protein n=1 Tax=Paraburkholderia bryophila TaxID=420952 RepID=UPI002349F65B|nr:hypothetical protein [Paraburkholderia bryophila]WCM21349.1 hypothetical protein NDK50_07850 [Paraburkholderia bryophila]
MALEQDFLPYAVGGSANVLSQSAYAALTTLLQNGLTSGIVPSNELNKILRQPSIIASVIAQFIVNNAGQPAIDDGTTATLLANLGTAVAVTARQNPVLTDTGTANVYVVANLAAFTSYPAASGLVIDVSVTNANTGASTLNVDGLGAKPIYGLGLQPLQGGELVAKGVANLLYIVASTVNSGNGAFILMECAGGAQQVAPATQPQHAVQLQQAQAMRGTFNGFFSYNANQSITAAQAGAAIDFYGTTASQTLTQPSVSSVPIGASYYYVNSSLVPVTVARAGSDTFALASGGAATSIVMQPGDDLECVAANSGTQWTVSGSAARQFAPLVVGAATAVTHAPQMGQVAGVVGSVRNLVMSVTAASATATLTADEIIVETALGGVRYCLPSFSKTINLATTGAGGMDTGTAPASGFVAIYAIWNPTTGTAALLAQNAATLKPNVYGGANMPAGYTASGLVAVVPTNASSQFPIIAVLDRKVSFVNSTLLGTTAGNVSVTSLSIAAIVPANAKSVQGTLAISSSATAATSAVNISPTSQIGVLNYSITTTAAQTWATPYPPVDLPTPQTIFYSLGVTAGTSSFSITASSYTI